MSILEYCYTAHETNSRDPSQVCLIKELGFKYRTACLSDMPVIVHPKTRFQISNQNLGKKKLYKSRPQTKHNLVFDLALQVMIEIQHIYNVKTLFSL